MRQWKILLPVCFQNTFGLNILLILKIFKFYFFQKDHFIHVSNLQSFLPFLVCFYLFISIFFYFTILYWFCHTSTCIRHGCTRVSHPEPPSHLPNSLCSKLHFSKTQLPTITQSCSPNSPGPRIVEWRPLNLAS